MLLNKLLEELPAEINGEDLEIHKIPAWSKQPTWLIVYCSDVTLAKPLYEVRDNDLLLAALKMKNLIGKAEDGQKI